MIPNSPNMTALIERLNTVNFAVPEYQRLLKMMQEQLESVAVRLDTETPWGPGNRAPVRAIIVTGAHHAGISDLVAQCLEALQPVTTSDGKVLEPFPRTIDAPFVFTQASQAKAISAGLGYPMQRRMPPDLAWEKVFDRLEKVEVRPLVIDNWHWSFTPAQVGQRKYESEKQKIQAAYVALLEHPIAPLALVLVGRSEALAELRNKGMEKLPDNSDSLEVERMANDGAEQERLRDGLAKLCEQAGLELSLNAADQAIQRLIHASDRVRGTAIVLCKLAVLHAVRLQASRLEFNHLQAAYASSMNGALSEGNPFAVENWSAIDTSGTGIETSIIEKMRRMNRETEKTDAA